jgi:hypothetical protein
MDPDAAMDTHIKRPNAMLMVSSGLYLASTLTAISIFSIIGAEVSGDVKTLSKVSGKQAPCGYAVPTLAEFTYGMGFENWPVTMLPDSGKGFYEDSIEALCKKDTLEETIQTLYQGIKHIDPDEAGVKTAVCDKSALEQVRMRNLHAPLYMDPVSRLVRAYMRAGPAFTHYNNNKGAGGRCEWTLRPLNEDDCARKASLDSEMISAAATSLLMIQGQTAAIPTVTQMTTRLLSLALLAFGDRQDNAGNCFKNALEANPEDLCQTVYTGVGTGSTAGPPYPFETVYAESGHASFQCVELPIRSPPPSPPPAPAIGYGEYETGAALKGHVRHCIRVHEFGQYDVDALFGLPDFERRGSTSIISTGFASGTSAIYDAMYEAWYADKREMEVLTSPRRDAMLFAAYRLGATMVWLTAALCCTCYWLARGVAPLAAIGLPTLKDFIDSRDSGPIALKKPKATSLQWIAVIATVLTAVYMCLVDPVVTALYQRDHCDDYDKEGTVWGTSLSLRSTGLVAVVLITLIALYVVIYETFLSGKHVVLVPRTTGFLSVLALVLVIAILVFDILLLVDSVDKWRLQLTKYTNNEAALEAEADTIKRDVNVLIMTATFYSFSTGFMTMRWVFYKQSHLMKMLWVGACIAPIWIAYTTRMGTTSDDLKKIEDETGYSPRAASHWTALACTIVLSVIHAYFYKEAADHLTPDEAADKARDEAEEMQDAGVFDEKKPVTVVFNASDGTTVKGIADDQGNLKAAGEDDSGDGNVQASEMVAPPPAFTRQASSTNLGGAAENPAESDPAGDVDGDKIPNAVDPDINGDGKANAQDPDDTGGAMHGSLHDVEPEFAPFDRGLSFHIPGSRIRSGVLQPPPTRAQVAQARAAKARARAAEQARLRAVLTMPWGSAHAPAHTAAHSQAADQQPLLRRARAQPQSQPQPQPRGAQTARRRPPAPPAVFFKL